MIPIDKNDHPLSDLLKRFMHQDKIKPRLYQKRIEQAWLAMMGKTINRHTVSIKIRDQVLLVKVSSSSLMHELHFARPEMLERFNEILEEEYLKDIRIVS